MTFTPANSHTYGYDPPHSSLPRCGFAPASGPGIELLGRLASTVAVTFTAP